MNSDMKYIKNRNQFLESKDTMKDDALHILASNDDNQDSKTKETLDKLDKTESIGKVVTRFAPSPTGFLAIVLNYAHLCRGLGN